MNKFIKEQLNKCKIAKIPNFNESTTQLLIAKLDATEQIKQVSSDLVINHYYKIRVEDYIIHPFPGFDLHTNWNNNIIPTDNIMKVEITQIMGKMIKVEAVGDNDGKSWSGWLPRKSIMIIEEI